MTNGRRLAAIPLAIGIAVGLVAPACGGDDSASAARALRRRTAGRAMELKVKDGGRVAGNVAEIEVAGAGLELVEPDGDTSGRTASLALFVDRAPVAFDARIPEGTDVIRTTETTVSIPGLGAGSHTVVAVLADGAERRIGDKAAEATLEVTGPTLDATAPASIKAGESLTIAVVARGVTLADPSATPPPDATTAHVDVFVDRPTAGKDPAPVGPANVVHTSATSVRLDGLGNGIHEIWVVLAHGDHVAYDPVVGDRVVVEVA